MNKYYHPDSDFLRKLDVAPPEATPHGTDDEIRANLKRAVTSNWRLEGNKLIADTDLGELVQTIPTNYICLGTDNNGMPILKKIEV